MLFVNEGFDCRAWGVSTLSLIWFQVFVVLKLLSLTDTPDEIGEVGYQSVDTFVFHTKSFSFLPLKTTVAKDDVIDL